MCPDDEFCAISSAGFQKLHPDPHSPVASEDRRAHRAARASPVYVGSASDCAWPGTHQYLQLAGHFRLDAVLPPLRRVEQL